MASICSRYEVYKVHHPGLRCLTNPYSPDPVSIADLEARALSHANSKRAGDSLSCGPVVWWLSKGNAQNSAM